MALEGYDVWVGCTRGRAYTMGHDASVLDPDFDAFDYWDYSFYEMGNEDIVSMVDRIIAERNSPDDGCSKVTIVTHSTGANAVLVAA